MANSYVWDPYQRRTTTFCSLCGVLIDPWQGDLTTEPELNWLNEVRAVRSTDVVDDVFVTGIGYLNFIQEVCAPRDGARRYDERPGPGENSDPGSFLEAHAHFNLSKRYICFAFHNACWDLLRDRVDPGRRVSANTLGKHLFALLYNTPVNGQGTLVPGHDYGGASEFQRPSRPGYFAIVNVSRLPYITSDPIEALQTDNHYLWQAVQAVSAPFDLPDAKVGNYSDRDVFCSLPNEIVMLILERLASADLCHFRLASRYVADLSSPNLLSQEFWASRFGRGFEMGFVFAGSPDHHPPPPPPPPAVDWRQLYIQAKAMLSDSRLFPGFRNRRRIWRTLQGVSDALRLRVENEGWITDRPFPDPRVVDVPSGMALESCISADVVLRDDCHDHIVTRDLDVSCRLFETQTLLFPREAKFQGLKLGISYVFSNGSSYISGLRMIPSPADLHEQARVGYVNPRREDIISLHPNRPLRMIEAAVTAKGIVGLSFHTLGSHGSSLIHSVGDMIPRDPSSGIGRLQLNDIDDASSWTGLAVGLDACKIIAISLVKEANGLEEPNTFQDIVPNRLHHGVEIWNPKVPDSTSGNLPIWSRIDPPGFFDHRSFHLFLDMDFGGPDGQLLWQLTRIDMIMGGFPAVFIGMTFVYSDGSERFYGRRAFLPDNTVRVAGVSQSFHIDGPTGEVITRVMVSYFNDDIVQGISSPDNYYFCALGARSQIVGDNSLTGPLLPSLDVSHNLPITAETLKSAEEMLAYPRGFAFTAADLSNVRAARVSLGDMEGRSRSETHISGLWLEYRDSRTPVILGQWIQEHGDSLTLEPGDRITEMATWHDYTNSYKRVKFGPVLKLRLVTARGVVKEFLDRAGTSGKICLVYRENPYEKLHAILWGCNFEWDHVRALYAPKKDAPGSLLITVPGSARAMGGAAWMVKEKGFMVEKTKDGQPNPAVAIEISYKDLGSEPAGLTLIYEDGKELTLGAKGKRAQRSDLQPGEALARMEIGLVRGNRIGCLTFHTSTDRKLHFQDTQGRAQPLHAKAVYVLATTAATTTAMQPAETPKDDGQKPAAGGGASKRVAKEEEDDGGDDDGSVKTSRLEVPKGNYGAFVGFWAVPKRRDRSLRYLLFGPIFETKEDGEGYLEVRVRK